VAAAAGPDTTRSRPVILESVGKAHPTADLAPASGPGVAATTPGPDTEGLISMPEPKLPPALRVQAFLAAPELVRAHAIRDRVSLLFGDDVHGVRFMGNRDDLWRLIGQAGRQLATLTDEADQ
jgi:hypothetical protein